MEQYCDLFILDWTILLNILTGEGGLYHSPMLLEKLAIWQKNSDIFPTDSGDYSKKCLSVEKTLYSRTEQRKFRAIAIVGTALVE